MIEKNWYALSSAAKHNRLLGRIQIKTEGLAGATGRRLYAAHQSADRQCRRALESVYAVDRSPGIVLRAEKRAPGRDRSQPSASGIDNAQPLSAMKALP